MEILDDQIPYVDLHVHTSFTDGKATVEACVRAARKFGLKAIGFAEHVSLNQLWLDTWYPNFQRDITGCRITYPDIEIYRGVEAKIIDYDGQLNVPATAIEDADFVIGVVHTYPKDRAVSLSSIKELPQETVRQIEVRASLAILENPCVTVIGHVGAIYGKYFGQLPIKDFDCIIQKAARKGVAFEINSMYHRYFVRELLNLCADQGARVTLGSDAHTITEIGEVVNFLRRELRK